MKIAFIEQESQLGGVEYTTLRVAKTLDNARFSPVILCPEEGRLPKLAREAALAVHIVPRPAFESVSWFVGGRYIANPFGFAYTAMNVLRAARQMQQYLVSNPVGIVVTKGLLAHFYGGLAALRLKIPCIWYIQEEVDKKRGQGIYRYILKQGARRIPSRIIVDAIALLEQFGINPGFKDRIEVIYNGVDTEEFSPFSPEEKQVARNSFDIPSSALVIGEVGRIVPLKGQHILLEAFSRLAGELENAHLLFVGAPLFGNPAYERALRDKARSLGLQNRVHFSGFLPDVRQGLAAMDIFVHPSVETDSPVSLLEAMACEKPAIVSGVPGTVEMVNHGVNALVVSANDAIQLAQTIRKLIEQPELRNCLSKNARLDVLQKFSLQKSVEKLQMIFEQLYAH